MKFIYLKLIYRYIHSTKGHISLACILFLLMSPSGLSNANSPGSFDKIRDDNFQIVGWDLGRNRPNEFKSWIDEAEMHGVNVITLSHDISHRWFQILEDESHARNVEELASYARGKGMDVYLWLRDFEKPPEKFISSEGNISYMDYDNPELWVWLDSIYQGIMDAIPSMAGVVLFLTEADWMVHRGEHEPEWIKPRRMQSELAPQERMAKLMNSVYNSLASRGKHMMVRDFFRSPLEKKLFLKALECVPEDVWIYSKHVPDDYRYNYPMNPNIGLYGNRVNVVEMEPGWVGGVYYYQQQIQEARDRGVQGIIPRIRFDVSTARDFNNYVFFKLIQTPDIDIDDLWVSYYVERYGTEKAAMVAKDVLPKAFLLRFVNNYHLSHYMDHQTGFYLMKNDEIREASLSDSRLRSGQSGGAWFHDPELENYPRLFHYRDTWIDFEQRIMNGDLSLIDLLVAEKKWCEALADTLLDKVMAARLDFDPADFSELYNLISDFRKVSRTMQVWAPAYISLKYWRLNKSDASALISAHNFLEEIKKLLDMHNYTKGLDVFYIQMHQELPSRPEPIEKPATINLFEPKNNSLVNTDELRFIWRKSEPAVSKYNLEISADLIFENLIVDTVLTHTTVVLRGMQHVSQYFWRVRAWNQEGWGPFSQVWRFTNSTTNVLLHSNESSDYTLNQNFPNPFSDNTTISFELKQTAQVSLSVFNAQGRELMVLVYDKLDAGSYQIPVDLSGHQHGLYFYQFVADAFLGRMKMLHLR